MKFKKKIVLKNSTVISRPPQVDLVPGIGRQNVPAKMRENQALRNGSNEAN